MAGGVRIGATAIVAVLLAAEVARLTVAARLSDKDPQTASRLAPASPEASIGLGMAEVGASAARGEAPGQRTLERFSTGASAAPLRPEPFLVQAALAERAGDLDRAEALLKQARWRDPRSTAARYLLADVALRLNEVVEGLTEMAAVSRLLAGGATQIVPALSQYAHAPGAREQLAAVLKSNPRLKQPLLETLAADPAT